MLPPRQDTFPLALDFVLGHEGGYVADPRDPGGATNHGVSLAWLRKAGLLDLDHDGHPDGDIDLDGDIDPDDIRALQRDDAARLYRHHWWDRYSYGVLPPVIAIKVFDLAVNMGASQAHRLLQRACTACGQPVREDGVLGPQTRTAVWAVRDDRLLTALCEQAESFYLRLVTAAPAREVFLKGWLRRAKARPVVAEGR